MKFSYRALFCYVIVVDLVFGFEIPEVNTELIRKINKMNTTWKAGVNRVKFPKKFKPPRGPRKLETQVREPAEKNLTSYFDVRKRWPKCSPITTRIRDQGACASSYAVAVASMMSDRACIQSNGTWIWMHHFSAHEILSCCRRCPISRHTPEGIKHGQPCEGGDVVLAILYFKEGVVTGGEVDSNEGCKPFGRKFYEGGSEECVKKCTNPNYSKGYQEDKLYSSNYSVLGGEKSIQRAIAFGGPVVSEIKLYEDLLYYKSGIYQHVAGKQLGMLAIKLIGWGEKDGTKYWIVVNSHGKEYGYKGTMRFLRGVHHCQIEYGYQTTVTEKKSPHRQAALQNNEAVVIKHFSFKYLVVGVIVFKFLLYRHK